MSNFSNYKKFENVGIRSSNDTLIVMDSTNNNISLHSSDGGGTNVDTLSIKNIINKTPNMDLNLSSLNGNTINPVITINNNNQDCRINTNLNVSGNLNITGGGVLKTTGIGSFGSIRTGVGTFTSINSGSGEITTTGIGSFGSIRTGVGTFTSINSGSITTVVGTFAVSNSVDSAGNMFWAGATSNYNFDKQLIINTTGAELSNGTNTYILPSADGTLALTIDIPSSTWTVNGTDIYPADSNVNQIKLTSSSSTGLYFNNAVNQGFKMFADSTADGGAVINNLSSDSDWLLRLELNNTPYHQFNKGYTLMYGDSNNITRNYFEKANNNSGHIIENDLTNNTFKLKTYTSGGEDAFMSCDLSDNNNRTTTFDKCDTFRISSGLGANGNCTLIIQADTDNTVETANPRIVLKQDGPYVSATIELEDSNDFVLTSNYTGANLRLKTDGGTIKLESNTTVAGTLTTTGVVNVGDHIQLVTDPSGSSGTYIRDPGATVTGQEHRLYWDTASVLTMVNCGSSVGEVKLAVGGAEKIIANSTGCRIAGVFTAGNGEFRIERIASLTYLYNPGGSHTANNNGEATAAGSYISYHDNGSALYFNLPNGSTAAGNYISFATGNSQQMRIEMGGDLYVCGTVYDGDCPSDSRLKHNQKVYDKNATDILNKIVIKDFMKSQIINFDDKDPDDTSKGMKPFYERLCPMEDCKYDIGVIAQELYEIPELSFMVDTEDWGEEKPATIPNWNPLISLLIKSNQEQETKIIKLETELDTVKTELDTYKLLMDKLTSATSFNAFKDSLI